jgi:hypothetical protein
MNVREAVIGATLFTAWAAITVAVIVLGGSLLSGGSVNGAILMWVTYAWLNAFLFGLVVS